MSQKSKVKSLILVLLISLPCFAESGASFLRIDPLPHPAALGGAFSAISDDLSALYYNPAGLAQLKYPEGVAGASSWINQTKIGLIGCCSPLSENSGFGISALYLKTDKMPLYKDEIATLPEGEFLASDLAIRFGYGVKFTKANYFGITGGFLAQVIEKEKSNGFFFDVGEIYKPADHFAFSVVLQNIGQKIKFIKEEDELPTRLRIGLGYHPVDNFLFALDFIKPRDNDWQTRGGMEWHLNNILSLRGGYNSQVFRDLGIGISGGFGIHIQTFKLDYTYVPYHDLGETHHLSFTTHFGR